MTAARSGGVRAARITDLAALGELSRLAHPPQADGHLRGDHDARDVPRESSEPPTRSLGLPVPASHVSVFSLFRMPLGAFQPHDQLYVYEQDGRLAGLARAERDTSRDEWTIVELDAIDQGDAGDIRFRLVQHLLRDGGRRGAARFHVACADEDGNVELFMQAGFARYGEETILHRSRRTAVGPGLTGIDTRCACASARPRRSTRSRSTRSTAVSPRRRWRAWRATGCRTGSACPTGRASPARRSRRSCASPTWTSTSRSARRRGSRAGGLRSRSVWPRRSSRTTCGCCAVPRSTTRPTHPLRPGPHRPIGAGTPPVAGTGGPHQGVLSVVRTYESPLERRLEEAGLRSRLAGLAADQGGARARRRTGPRAGDPLMTTPQPPGGLHVRPRPARDHRRPRSAARRAPPGDRRAHARAACRSATSSRS